MKELDLAYIGGLFDGEGCIQFHFYHTFRKSNNAVADSSVIFVHVNNTNKAMIEYLHSNFGGAIIARKYNGANAKPCYEWRLNGGQAFPFLRLIAPYLRMKQVQATTLLAHEAIIRRKGKRSEENKQILRVLSDKFRILNKRGVR